HETGTRDMRRINGLWKYMPHTALLAMVASLAMAGVPLLNGFLSKEMFFGETLQQNLYGGFNWLVPTLATLASVFSVAYSLRFIHDVFFNGEPVDLPKFPPHEPPRYMKIPVEILVLLCLVVGMLPAWTVAPLLASAASASLNGLLPEYSLSIWHGLNMPLAMSTVALLGGLALYAARKPLYAWFDGLPSFNALMIFDRAMTNLVNIARRLTRVLENGSLQSYLIWVLVLTLVLVVVALSPLRALTGELAMTPIDPVTALGLVVLMVAGLLTVVYKLRYLTALALLSVVGLMVSLVFARFSAPDLALTQLAVEVVSIILMLLALFFLPARAEMETSSLRGFRDMVVAIAVGTLVAVLAFAVLTRPYETIAGFFLANSVSGGGGTNVVNVILVDFRGFDTLGEISVLAIAAVAIYGLLHGLHLPHPRRDSRGQLRSTDT